MRNLKELASEAIGIQNASNMLGLSKRMAEAVQEVAENLRASGNVGTDEINRHPIVQLWASKLHDLAGMGLSNYNTFGAALAACEKLAASRPTVVYKDP